MKIKKLAIAAIIGLGIFSLASKAAELPNGPHVITSGSAQVNAMPDMAVIMIDVSISSKDAVQVKKQIDERVAKYFSFLQKSGVALRDINAANINIQPEREYLKNGESVLKGYRAVRQVKVTLRHLDKLNELLDGALKAGLNEINTIEFSVANPNEYRDQARQEAIENAIEQAELLAKGFDAKLGAIYSIRYHVANSQPMSGVRVFKTAFAAPGSDVAQTYQQQLIQFSDQVDVVFELQPRAIK
jgi:uncharacterized protein YggE